MNKNIASDNHIIVFKNNKIRRLFHEGAWWFSIIDVISALTDSVNPRDYWYKMKIRVKSEEGAELSTFCRQLKLKAPDGKLRETDCANTESLFRNLRDHMTDLELIFSMLGEASTTEIARENDAQGFDENHTAARAGGEVAGNARKDLEARSGKRVTTTKNYLPSTKKLKRVK